MAVRPSARIQLSEESSDVIANVRWERLNDPFEQVTYFHATYGDHPKPEPGKDLLLLDTRETETGGDWSGNFVGTSWMVSHEGSLKTIEGDRMLFLVEIQTVLCDVMGTNR